MAITLTDAQWERIRQHFPEENIPGGRPGRKPVPTRRVLEAVLAAYASAALEHPVELPLPPDNPVYQLGVLGLRELDLPTSSVVRRKGLFGVTSTSTIGGSA